MSESDNRNKINSIHSNTNSNINSCRVPEEKVYFLGDTTGISV